MRFKPEDRLNLNFLFNIAEDFSLDKDILLARLNHGCPLSIALLLPEHYIINKISKDDDGKPIFDICRPVFRGSGDMLIKLLKRDDF